jgi:hypothetical protein
MLTKHTAFMTESLVAASVAGGDSLTYPVTVQKIVAQTRESSVRKVWDYYKGWRPYASGYIGGVVAARGAVGALEDAGLSTRVSNIVGSAAVAWFITAPTEYAAIQAQRGNKGPGWIQQLFRKVPGRGLTIARELAYYTVWQRVESDQDSGGKGFVKSLALGFGVGVLTNPIDAAKSITQAGDRVVFPEFGKRAMQGALWRGATCVPPMAILYFVSKFTKAPDEKP